MELDRWLEERYELEAALVGHRREQGQAQGRVDLGVAKNTEGDSIWLSIAQRARQPVTYI